jgi:hypothetical protein
MARWFRWGLATGHNDESGSSSADKPWRRRKLLPGRHLGVLLRLPGGSVRYDDQGTLLRQVRGNQPESRPPGNTDIHGFMFSRSTERYASALKNAVSRTKRPKSNERG